MEEVSKQVDLEIKLEDQKDTVRVVQKHFDKLSRALSVLEGRDVTLIEVESGVSSAGTPPASPQVVPKAPPAPSPKPQRQGPICSACGDDMIRLARTTRSGVYVEYWGCSDGKCGNEQY